MLSDLTNDTKAIIASIVGTGIVLAGLLLAVLSAQFADVHRRFDDMLPGRDGRTPILGLTGENR